MKNIQTFESFLYEATAVDNALEIGRRFLDAVEAEFKTEIHESQMIKMSPKGFEIRAVIFYSNIDKMNSWAKDYTEKHKDDVKGVPLQFKVSQGIQGRSTLWPSDWKKYFDIVR